MSKGTPVDVKMQNGTQHFGQLIDDECWSDCWDGASIIAYRLHRPEQSMASKDIKVTPYGDSTITIGGDPMTAMRRMQDSLVFDTKPTTEQLAADYRNAKDYCERKQQEADSARADVEAKLAELVAAGKAIGLVLSVASPEPELVITDWRDLRVGDEIEARCHSGVLIGLVTEMEPKDYDGERPFRFQPFGESTRRCTSSKFKFIRRP